MANSPSRVRPPLLPLFRTCIWKIVGQVAILLDIYLPSKNDGSRRPIMLYIHGGGWIASNRQDYSRPLFHQFLSLGFVVVSMDYRLLPETTFDGQLEDIRDIQSWLKNSLPSELEESNFTVAADKIIVAGGSAGAHLALLTVISRSLGHHCSLLTSMISQSSGPRRPSLFFPTMVPRICTTFHISGVDACHNTTWLPALLKFWPQQQIIQTHLLTPDAPQSHKDFQAREAR